MAAYLDDLVGEGMLRFWELADPAPLTEEATEDRVETKPWELVHPQPVDGDSGGVALS